MSYYSTFEKLILSFSIKKCMTNYHYKISLSIEDSSSGCKEKYESEEKQCPVNDSLLIFEKKMLCNYFFEKEQKITISISKKNSFDSKNILKDLERHTTLSSLIASPNSIYKRELIDNNPEIICIQLDKENSLIDNKKYSLFDFFKKGLKLSCFISMDFSESNKNIKLLDAKNNYVEILKNISHLISNYLSNQAYYALGFGGNDKNISTNCSIFNLNEYQENPTIHTIETVIKNFNNCLDYNFIVPDNKINLSIMIKNVIKEIYKLYEIKFYHSLFIIIRNDNDKKDVKKTIDAIIESSYLPLTIFILGVGNNDYYNVKKIFNKKYEFSSFGMEKRRNNTIFASLKDDFSNDEEKMISWCAAELSKQIISFYDLTRIKPQNIYDNIMNNKEDNLNIYDNSIWSKNKFLEDESPLNKLNSALMTSISPFSSSNSYQYKKKEGKIEDNKKDNNIEKKENDINENTDKIEVSMKNLSQNSSNINTDNIEKSTINATPDVNILEKKNNSESINSNKNIKNENKKTKDGENSKPKIEKENPNLKYDKKESEENLEAPPMNWIQNTRTIDIDKSNIVPNINEKNPYLKEYSETIGKSNDSKGLKNNIAGSAQSTSTQNSDQKNSFFLFNSLINK